MNKSMKYISVGLLSILIVMASCKSNKKPILKPYEKELFKENLVKANKGLINIDQEKIKEYADRRNWQMIKTESGMWYQIIQGNKQNSDSAKVGKIAHLKYTVSLLDGTLCYTSDSTGNMLFKIGHGGVEFGLEQAILLMKIGDKGRFIMPPHLAHGLLGDENKIPLRTTIVYQAELINLTN